MRKLLLAALSLLSFAFSYTQVNEADNAIAKQLVGKNSAALGLTANDINNSIVANTYKVTGSADLRMVYLQQSYLGVPVFNELQVLAFDRERLVSNAGSRIASLESKVNSQDGIPALTVLDAVRNSLLDAKLISSEQIVPINITSDGRKYEFGKLGVAVENITAELMWYPVADDKKVLRLAWQVFLAPANSSDYWLVRIDAMTGNVLAKQNLTITCHWDDRRHSVKEHVEKNHVATASIAGPQQPVFFKKREKEVNWKYRPLLINSANYRVVPYPYESPTHMGGGGSGLVNNPWTMAPGNATSLGWHNDGLLVQ